MYTTGMKDLGMTESHFLILASLVERFGLKSHLLEWIEDNLCTQHTFPIRGCDVHIYVRFSIDSFVFLHTVSYSITMKWNRFVAIFDLALGLLDPVETSRISKRDNER